MKFSSVSEENPGLLAPPAHHLTVGLLPHSWVCGDVGTSDLESDWDTGKGLVALGRSS